MAPSPSPSRRTPTGRRRGRPPGTTNAARAARQASLAASEPPPKKRRYVPGGPGGGGRFVDPGELETPQPNGSVTVSRPRVSVIRDALNGPSPSLMPQRERSTRTRAAAADNEEFGFSAAVTASVHQADDYKPREERNWEEFHPHLDIEKAFMVLRSEDVDGITQEPPVTPAPPPQTSGTPMNGSMTPSKQINPVSTGNTPSASTKNETNPFDTAQGTPTRRSRRPTRDVVSFYGVRPLELSVSATPKAPKVLPIKNQTAKEKLDLKQPSYRKTNRIEIFESKTSGQARYVDKAMSNVGYQESDHFIRPEPQLIKATDANADEDPDQLDVPSTEDAVHHSRFGRVEYDMDEQDDMWLSQYNLQRKASELEAITREIFEITMTKIEKEWHALEKRIPKPNPKPPQTHRPRSGSAAAVNGEPPAGEEPDTKCAICDDGDCENTNAIVFCDGCNLAVHQECYGVPFIPEGQWLCRKCQLCGRGVPTCIFCPNTDGAFKQTNSSKWAHLLCAMWIPEVSLGNHTFMEPVMDVEKVPKTRWKLHCYICNQKMGACIQCGNKNCYQAFHVTCARRARLSLKMKTPAGQLAILDGNMVLKAFCDKHCPPDYTVEHDVANATRSAKRFYRRNMKGRIWADNHAVANVIAAQQRNAITDHAPDASQLTGEKNDALIGDKKKGQQPKNIWRLPSGAPVIPQAVFDTVEASLQRFPFRKRKDYLSEACRYWTLKREARRGAALLKRLQLQMDSFSSMELTRRNFATMGPDGKDRLARRIQFAEMLIKDLEQLKDLSEETVQREQKKLEAAELEENFVDQCYFPVAKLLGPAIDKAISLDKDLFERGLLNLRRHVEKRHYANALTFAQELCDVVREGIIRTPDWSPPPDQRLEASEHPSFKNPFQDVRERRKLGKRILKAVQPQLETALRVESEISNKPFETVQRELEAKLEASIDMSQQSVVVRSHVAQEDDGLGTIMVDASPPSEIRVKTATSEDGAEVDDAMDTEGDGGGNIEVNTSGLGITNGDGDVEMADRGDAAAQLTNGVGVSQTPPGSNSYGHSPKRRTQNGPPSPPQSNGSLGKDPDPLADGGVFWYLKALQPVGTSILEDDEPTSSEDVRMMSEDLTDLDDEELKALGAEVDESLAAAVAEAEAEAEATTAAALMGKASRVSPRKRRTSARRR